MRIRNITQASRFDCFTITLVARRSESLVLGDAAGQQHQLRGTVFASFTVKLAKPNEWEIEATNISPGADIALFVPATGIGKPAVLASSCAGVLTVEAGAKEDEEKKVKSKVSAGVLPVLVEQSQLTWFVDYEIAILWSALALWAALMFMSMNMVRNRQTTAPRTPSVDEVRHDILDTID